MLWFFVSIALLTGFLSPSVFYKRVALQCACFYGYLPL